jgi:death-on-curing family protein
VLSNIKTLSHDEIVYIHNRLTIDAESSDDPISPPGIKNMGLLESAVARQYAGYDGHLKYSDPISNAATLCYGICSNHALHNGNKRTALVSLICHLDKNGITFTEKATQNVLYSFMLDVANHGFVKKNRSKNHDQSDVEVKEMTDWIRKKTRKIEKGERSLSYPELERALRNHGVIVEHKGNTADLFRCREETKGWFRKEKVLVKEKVANVPWWPGRSVGKNLVKSIRKQAKLTVDDGVDSAQFYGTEITPDDYIQRYKTTLHRLAKT